MIVHVRRYLFDYGRWLYGELRQLRDITRSRMEPRLRSQWLEGLRESDDEHTWNFVREVVPPQQIKSELFDLVDYLRTIEPKVYCEIGIANGGTNYFVTQRCASIEKVIGLDLHIKNAHILKDLCRPKCKVTLINGRSDSSFVRDRVSQALKGRKIDVLLIDGDHSYAGVSSDFQCFKDFVRDGGLIVFHDVVEDYGTRFGRKTTRNTGGVPRFFREIANHYESQTFIADPEQDGFGIGCVLYRRDVDPREESPTASR